jgi:hypothetical protein
MRRARGVLTARRSLPRRPWWVCRATQSVRRRSCSANDCSLTHDVKLRDGSRWSRPSANVLDIVEKKSQEHPREQTDHQGETDVQQ